MATRTIARMYDSYADASAAVGALESAGFSHDDVSLVANRGDAGAADGTADAEAGSGAGAGATLGTLVGGGAGLLAGLGALAIPGIGPLVAAGWLVAAVTGAGVGAAAGGLLGGLMGSGVSEEDANVYAEGVRRGGNLVTVRADETRVAEAEAIMMRYNPVDTATRATEYRAGGWNRYDETAGTTSAATGVGAAAAAGMGLGARASDYSAGGMAATPDGTPGNPRGTMLSRGVDDALGTNVSGARPENEMRHAGVGTDGYPPDGTPGNPPGTVVSRGVDDALGTNVSGARPENEMRHAGLGRDGYPADGTPGNPPGTMASRGLDQAAGTNVSGAYPGNEAPRRTTSVSAPGGVRDDGSIIPNQPDGAPGNPPGTMVSRGLDEVAGTNISGAHPENEASSTRSGQGERIGRTADRVLGTSKEPPPKR